MIMIPLILGLVVAQSQGCPDFSGNYVIQGEDGKVELSIKQAGCQSITIDRKNTYLGKTTKEKTHTLKLDGKFQDDEGWFGGSDKLKVSARMTEGHLEIVAKSASLQLNSTVFWQDSYELLPNRDVLITESYSGGQSGAAKMTAHRQR
jgi:hypothetical protein